MSDEIPLFEIAWGRDEIANAVDSIGRGSHWAKGPYVSEFEEQLESYLGVEHAMSVNSGTTALVAALTAHEIGKGDEVIVPSFTFIATANAVRLVGAEPVFADIESKTYGLDPDDVRTRISEDTVAILPVHCYGAACKIDEICSIAKKHDLLVIEDAAEALGAEYGSEKLGTFGDSAILSFCQNKIVATGEGGAVVTDDDEIAEKVRLYRSHGRPSSEYFERTDSGEYVSLGTNIRMSDLTASLGCAQMDNIEQLISARQSAATRLNDAFARIDGVTPHKPPRDGQHVYQLYTVEFAADIDRMTIAETLSERNIASKIYWDPPVHQTSYYQGTIGDCRFLPTTDQVANRVLSLPMYPNLSPNQIDRIVAGVETGIERAR